MRKILLTTVLAVMMILTAQAQNTHFIRDIGIAFQGYAKGSDNLPLKDQDITVKFTISASEDINAPSYQEIKIVTTDKFGIFSSMIGATTDPAKKAKFRQLKFGTFKYKLKVEVEVMEGNSKKFVTLSEKEFSAVPYAQAAGNGVMVGAVVAFAGNPDKIEKGWMLCDGRALSITEYPELYESIGCSVGCIKDNEFNIPNMQGYFLRSAAYPDPEHPNQPIVWNDPDAQWRENGGVAFKYLYDYKREHGVEPTTFPEFKDLPGFYKPGVGSTQLDDFKYHKHNGGDYKGKTPKLERMPFNEASSYYSDEYGYLMARNKKGEMVPAGDIEDIPKYDVNLTALKAVTGWKDEDISGIELFSFDFYLIQGRGTGFNENRLSTGLDFSKFGEHVSDIIENLYVRIDGISSNEGGIETRPKNLSVNYIIRVK